MLTCTLDGLGLPPAGSTAEGSIDDVVIRYETRGAGRPIVMLPGRPSDHRSLARLMEPLFEGDDGWLRIYVDLPGTGQSPSVEQIATHDAMIEVILAFLDRVIPDQRFAIVGFSYGGYLAQGVIARHAARIDGALLYVPHVNAAIEPARLPAQSAVVADPALAASLGPVAGMVVIQTPAVADAVREVLAEVAIADPAMQARLEASGPAAFERDAAGGVTLGAPTLILTARQDAICGYLDAWALVERYPRATFAVVDAGGHFVGIEQATLCHALIRDWLARIG